MHLFSLPRCTKYHARDQLDHTQTQFFYKMPRLDLNARKRIIVLSRNGSSSSEIHHRLRQEDIHVTKRSINRLLQKFRDHGSILDLPRRRREKIITDEMKTLIDEWMEGDDELTAKGLKSLLEQKHMATLKVSLSTIKRARRDNGWLSTHPHYCQLIREVNRVKRKEWCEQQLANNEEFRNVIFSDECTVQLEHHGKLCFRRRSQPRKLKGRPKHPAKIHLWGGISVCGATQIVMFSGNMDAIRYGEILKASLLPFIRQCHPTGHRLYQDNDPKHTSRYISNFFETNGIVWWKSPPESPDLNPIENIWGSLKQYLRTQYKPHNLGELKQGIMQFWNTLTPQVCEKYISHLKKVIPKVVEMNGHPSGY